VTRAGAVGVVGAAIAAEVGTGGRKPSTKIPAGIELAKSTIFPFL